MPTATPPSLAEETIDDLLYLARTGETADLNTTIESSAKNHSTTPSQILTSTIDPHSGNGLLHMASANGHITTLKSLLTLSTLAPTPSLNLQNASGNTPLHWAALNGHLEAVKLLVEAGADVTVINGAGHDAVYAAEVNEKSEVAEWLLSKSKGLESAVAGGRVEEGDIEGTDEGDSKAENLEGSHQGIDGGGP